MKKATMKRDIVGEGWVGRMIRIRERGFNRKPKLEESVKLGLGRRRIKPLS